MNDQQSWLRRIRELLDRSAQDLDASSASRLNRARQQALAQLQSPPRRWLRPSGLAAAAALLLVVVLGLRAPLPDSSSEPLSAVAITADEGELVGGDDNLELVQDLEFYAWLDTQDDDISG